jgi:hypothetical protein
MLVGRPSLAASDGGPEACLDLDFCKVYLGHHPGIVYNFLILRGIQDDN